MCRELAEVNAVQNLVLSENPGQMAAQLLAQICGADTLIGAVQAGAAANGFILGLETCNALPPEDAENLHIIFSAALEERFMALSSAN